MRRVGDEKFQTSEMRSEEMATTQMMNLAMMAENGTGSEIVQKRVHAR